MKFVCTRCKRDVDVAGNFCPYCGAAAPPPDAAKADPFIGRTIAQKYFINQPIGSGGMGSVYKATDLVLDRAVALKMLSNTLANDPQMVQRFHREARASSKLNHPNCITVLDFGQAEDGTLYIAMEFLSGKSLGHIITHEFPIAQGRVVRIVSQILSALADAHGLGIIHRDLKPSNVMVETRRDEPDFVKVLDFGIAKITEPNDGKGRLTQFGMVCGTPGYMSPEQARGEELDARSDLYAVGVILYEMVTGKLPFDDATPMAIITKQMMEIPQTPRERRPDLDISPELDALIVRAMSRDRTGRPASAEQFRAELLACGVPLELGQRATPPPQRSSTMLLDTNAITGGATPPPVQRPVATGPSPVILDASLGAPAMAAHGGGVGIASGGAGAVVVPPPRGTPAPAGHGTGNGNGHGAVLQGRGPTPKPLVKRPPQPEPEEPEADEEAQEEVRPKRATPPPKKGTPAVAAAAPKGARAAKGGKPQSRGLIYGIAGGGALVVAVGLFFLLTSDPFDVPETKTAAAPQPAAELKLGASAPATSPAGQPSLQPMTATAPTAPATAPSEPVTPPTTEPAPPSNTETAAAVVQPPTTPTTQPASTTQEPEPVKPAVAEVEKGSGVLQAVEGVRVLKVPGAGSGQGLLSVSASPWAVLYVDGKEIGETPRELRLGEGWYRITLKHPTLGTTNRRVTVTAGKRVDLNAKMAR